MSIYLNCGQLFDGVHPTAHIDQTLVIDGDRIGYIGPSSEAPSPAESDTTIDYHDQFVLPGLIDIHVHLSYGNAQANEDVDMYSPPEYRALRALAAAQKVLRAGYTSLADPASTNRVSPCVRDAINAGMFTGPRITASGRQITARQGLGDWYPSWIGVPESSVGVLVKSMDEAIEEIRLQVKDQVDFIKFTADGLQRNSAGELLACFNQRELTAMVEECHRLGVKSIAHARGREAVLTCARAGVDVIFHAFEMDQQGLDAVLESGTTLSPALTFLVNTVEFTREGDPCFKWRPNMNRNDVEIASEMLIEARKAGVPFMVGTDSGFAVTPYGEWHARELEIMVDYLGFSPAEALTCTTSENAKLLREGDRVGRLATGMLADLTVVSGNPLNDISCLQQRDSIKDVWLGGARVDLAPVEDAKPYNWEHSFRQWNDVYTRDRVAELRRG
jgi:imidazolonepropionase-like amidohydrolase